MGSASVDGMSTRKRVLLLALGMFQCFATSGIIYGWTSLDQLFVNEGVYSNLCPPGNQTCSAQNLRFNLIFTISSNINLAAGLLMGYILDRWGPRACVVQSMACVLGGCICVAFGSPTLDLYMAGMILIGFGGPGIQNGLIHLSNLFPNHKSLATCLITGSFQLSFAVFLVFEKIQVAGATHQTIFLGFSGLVLALIASSIFFWPPSNTTDVLLTGDEEGAEFLAPTTSIGGAGGSPSSTSSAAARRSLSTPPRGGSGFSFDDKAADPTAALLAGLQPKSIGNRTPSREERYLGIGVTVAPPLSMPPTAAYGATDAGTSSSSSSTTTTTTAAATTTVAARVASRERFPFQRLPSALVKLPPASPTKRAASVDRQVRPAVDPSSPSYQQQQQQHASAGGAGGAGGAGTGDGGGDALASLMERGFAGQICSWQFVCLTIYCSVLILWANSYMGTLRGQLVSLGASPKQVEAMANNFNVVSPCGVVIIPLIGVMLDRLGFAVVLGLGTCLAIAFALICLIPSVDAQYGAFVCYAWFRTTLFSTLFAYVADQFGFRYFGLLCGIVLAVAGALGMVQYGLTAVVESGAWTHQDINYLQLGTIAAMLFFPAVVARDEWKRGTGWAAGSCCARCRHGRQ